MIRSTHRRSRVALAALTVAVFAAGAARADDVRVKITLKDGTVVQGSLDERRERVYRLTVDGTPRTIREDDVRRVEFLAADVAVDIASETSTLFIRDAAPPLVPGKLTTKHLTLEGILGGHGGSFPGRVSALALSPDGTKALIGGDDTRLVLRDVLTGRDEKVFVQPKDGDIANLAFTPDGKRAICDGDRCLRIWDLASGRVVKTLANLHRVTVREWSMSADGRRAITGDQEGPVKVWDLATGKLVREVATPHEIATGVALSPDGLLAAIADGPNYDALLIRRVDVDDDEGVTVDSETIRKLGLQNVGPVTFTPDGKRVIIGAKGGLAVFDAGDGSFVRELPKVAEFTSVAVSPDGKRVLAGTWEGPFTLFDLESGSELYTFHDGHGTHVAFTPDGRHAVVGGQHVVQLWDLEKDEASPQASGHTGAIECLTLSADGKRALTSCFQGDPRVKLWDVASGAELWSSEAVTWTAALPGGSAVWNGTRLALRTDSGFETASGSLEGSDSALEPDGKHALIRTPNEGAFLWDLESPGARYAGIPRLAGGATFAFAPDGKSALAGGDPAWQSSPTNGAPIQRLDLEAGTATTLVPRADGHVAFSADRKRAVSSWDSTVRVWDLESGAVVRTIAVADARKGTVRCAALDEHGAQVLVGTYAGSVQLWDVAGGVAGEKPLARLEGHTGRVAAVAFLAGERAVSIGEDGTLRLWDLAKAAELESLDLGARGEPPRCLAIDPDGQHLLVGTESGVVLRFALTPAR